MEALVIGRPNSGKSLFMVNFVAYLGLKELRLEALDEDGMARRQRIPFDQARRQLVSHVAHKTTNLQSIQVDIVTGRSHRILTLTDSVGLTDEIHQASHIRRSMALTLQQLSQKPLVLHMMDASAGGLPWMNALSLVDDEVARYAGGTCPYVILANKMDCETAKHGLDRIRERFRGYPVIPISALTRRGFRDVKGYILRHWG